MNFHCGNNILAAISWRRAGCPIYPANVNQILRLKPQPYLGQHRELDDGRARRAIVNSAVFPFA